MGNRTLLDLALDRLSPVVHATAVNTHHQHEKIAAHLPEHVYLSNEQPEALGTAGAIGQLRSWMDGRDVLIVNGDTWCLANFAKFVSEWDRERVRIMVLGDAPFGPRSGIVASLLPWADASRLLPTPSGLYEVCWRQADEESRVETVPYDGPFIDCASPADYLRANLAALRHPPLTSQITAGSLLMDTESEVTGSARQSIIGAGAVVEGTIDRCVLWPGARVRSGEHLVDAIRIDEHATILIR